MSKNSAKITEQTHNMLVASDNQKPKTIKQVCVVTMVMHTIILENEKKIAVKGKKK